MQEVNNEDWVVQRMCTDIQDYELIVELEKSHWNCEQPRESWKWIVSYHGSIVARGSVNDCEEARKMALQNVPDKKKD